MGSFCWDDANGCVVMKRKNKKAAYRQEWWEKIKKMREERAKEREKRKGRFEKNEKHKRPKR